VIFSRPHQAMGETGLSLESSATSNRQYATWNIALKISPAIFWNGYGPAVQPKPFLANRGIQH
jgi:hypothetical protein